MAKKKKPTQPLVCRSLEKHFKPATLQSLISSARAFPATARVDLQRTLENYFTERHKPKEFLGFFRQYENQETLTFSHLLSPDGWPAIVGPLQYEDVDVGEVEAARCLKKGIWLCRQGDMPFVVVMSPLITYGRVTGVHLEMAVPPGEKGLKVSKDFFREVEADIAKAGSYRGKVLSLEKLDNYFGRSGGIKVHKLKTVGRDEVILPEKTLLLLERNVHQFVSQREKLRSLGMPVKKGLLFYGPPGTGKTHTISYLASQLPKHTTLLITADQVALLDEYMQLARFLQPSIVVIEDVDLIARERTQLGGPCAESMLNKLLNEMDGLREDAAILFVLTTNRPEDLEAALSSRPGRIDQAIEFPLPNDDGRKKLAQLYSRGLQVPDGVRDAIVAKTDRASAAFIKELMRRSAQYLLHRDGTKELGLQDVECALDEMLFSGGRLNAKLLGAATDPA